MLTVHSPDTRPCTFFRLVNIAQADPVVADQPWFAVSMAHQGHDVIVSMLLSAIMSGKSLSVDTTGKTVCGLAEVYNVQFSH